MSELFHYFFFHFKKFFMQLKKKRTIPKELLPQTIIIPESSPASHPPSFPFSQCGQPPPPQSPSSTVPPSNSPIHIPSSPPPIIRHRLPVYGLESDHGDPNADEYVPSNYLTIQPFSLINRSTTCIMLLCYSPQQSPDRPYCLAHSQAHQFYSIKVSFNNFKLGLFYEGPKEILTGQFIPALFITGKPINNLMATTVERHHRLIKLRPTLYLDTFHNIGSNDPSNFTKFIQHSETPNCRIQPVKDQITNLTQFMLVAIEKIIPPKELTMFYGNNYKEHDPSFANCYYTI